TVITLQNMTGKVLGIAFHLLLFSSVIQGLKHVELIHKEAVEAVEGQNVSLPCLVKNVSGLNVVSLEWKKDETKLGMYNSAHGHYYHWSNVTIQIKQDEAKKLSGSHLLLLHVNKWDSGVYVCEITSFPLGSFRKETNLTEIKLACEVDGGIEVNYGENALIHCSVSSNDAQYRWTKNENVVSDDASLKLWSVTGAHAGAYKLTVNTGGKTLHRVFTIVVLSATTGEPSCIFFSFFFLPLLSVGHTLEVQHANTLTAASRDMDDSATYLFYTKITKHCFNVSPHMSSEQALHNNENSSSEMHKDTKFASHAPNFASGMCASGSTVKYLWMISHLLIMHVLTNANSAQILMMCPSSVGILCFSSSGHYNRHIFMTNGKFIQGIV
uniref:Ig-like domain-containing protein n=1 Tax=Nothobranchius furzeri TaxID=105023 RepID=A0A8C6PND0_NOTFU